MGSIQGSTGKETAGAGGALVFGHLQKVIGIFFTLTCGCINGYLNVKKLERNRKIAAEVQQSVLIALYQNY
jgi:hypothetical protein